ncbi:MAG: tetratricopeptide repeat protein [Leptolyngbyaceae cyanobacterium SM1_1_3]|nr:tetratricopeptide repeat protein [Leptolyngbyaceae cyanobacterium SM1_1_3]
MQAYGDVGDLLPGDSDPSLRVLMTSRQRFGRPVDRLDLGVLSPAEALELFTRLIDNGARVQAEMDEAVALCEWVGRLPLGIELVGRYLALHPSLSLARMGQRLEEKRLQVRAFQQRPDEMAYELTLQVAFELSWQNLTPAAKTLAGLLSLFAPDPIPADLIARALPDWDEEDLEESLDGVLVHRSLVQIVAESAGTYQLHQLLREFIAEKLNAELAEQKTALQTGIAYALTAIAKEEIPQTVTLGIQAQVAAAIPHLAVVAHQLTHLLQNSTDAVWPYVGLARFYQGQSLWPEAEKAHQACLTMTEQRFGAEHPYTAISLNGLAALYYAMGRLPRRPSRSIGDR